MKNLLRLLGLALALATSLPAQEPAPAEAPRLTADQLDQLLGPIALYPDALIALILPASTASADIVLASRFLQAGNNPAGVDDQPWDDSVRSLAHYPDVVKWMDQNLAWTKQLGDAFLTQPAEVMKSVQRLRAAARAAGTLTDTPQQQLIVEGDAISIVPTQPDVIYVPYYDPAVVYVARPGYYNDPFLTFGVGFSIGPWLSFDLDWGHQRIWFIDRPDRERYWREHRDWRHPAFPGRPGYARDPDRHPWRPAPDRPRPPPPDFHRQRPDIVRPAPFLGAPQHAPVTHQGPPQNFPDGREHSPRNDMEGRVPPQNRAGLPVNPPPAPGSPAVAPPSTPADHRSGPPTRSGEAQPPQPGVSQTRQPPPAPPVHEFRGGPGGRPPPTNSPSPIENDRGTRAARQPPSNPPPSSPPPSVDRGTSHPGQVRAPQPAPPSAPSARQPPPPASDDDKKNYRHGSDRD